MIRCRPRRSRAALLTLLVLSVPLGVARSQDGPPEGFRALFNGTDLTGWKGLVGNPITRAAMGPEELAAAQQKADEAVAAHWRVEDGEIVNDGKGPHLCTVERFADFELLVDWMITPSADSGIYLRGTPQVQIWDPVAGIDRAAVGSGGLYNNQKHRRVPEVVADRPAKRWNRYAIRMIGERVSVWLNDLLVVDDVVMENYWDRSRPIFPREQIELQTHGGEIRFRGIYLREIAPVEANRWLQVRGPRGFVPLFNGKDLTGWTRSRDGYLVEDGCLVCDPEKGGTLLTEKEYGDFVVRFEFKLPPGGNNGLAIRAPLEGNPAYQGMEIQILDDSAPKHANLQPYQYHGSVYGLAPSHRGYQRAIGEWNFEEVTCRGSHITVALNGTVIVDVDLATIDRPMDGRDHPGMHRESGRIGFMGHGDRVMLRNIRLLDLP